MGKDDANRAAYETMVDLMYQKHPVRFPVAGTEESVKNTTAEKMQKVYDACYLPQKFWLICAGDVDDHQIMEATALVQEKESTGKIVYCKEPDTIQERYREIAMGLRRPVFQVGFKLEPRERNLREKIAMELLMDLWAGESSPFFLEAYEKICWMRRWSGCTAVETVLPSAPLWAVASRQKKRQNCFWPTGSG